MKKLILLTALISLIVGSVSAGVRYENTAGVSVNLDTFLIDAIEADFISDSVWIMNTGPMTTEAVIWDAWNTDKPNKSTQYISGLDTIITLHRIECDTTTVEKLIINDTTVIRLNVECDTIYRVEYRDVWEPKIKVFLNPSQLKQLMWLIQNSDMLEMKKEYGKK